MHIHTYVCIRSERIAFGDEWKEENGKAKLEKVSNRNNSQIEEFIEASENHRMEFVIMKLKASNMIRLQLASGQ